MRYFILSALIILLIPTTAVAQNFLPYDWKISFSDTIKSDKNPKIEDWQNVNLLLSWERQGYFWQNGKCCLAANFIMGDSKNSVFQLTIGLQCNVREIYINGNYVGGNLANQFWSNRDSVTQFTIPRHFLIKGKNRIEVYASDLSYTGGLSHNQCKLTPLGTYSSSTVHIEVPTDNHVFKENPVSLQIRIKALNKGVLSFSIKNDFHKDILKKSFHVDPSDTIISLDLSKEIINPGFYECTAILNDSAFSGDAQWFALSPEKISCQHDTIMGFKQYWDKTLLELQRVNPEFKINKVDSLCSEFRNGYVVEMKSLGNLTIRAYYFVPKNEEKHAAILHVPGYGWGFQDVSSFVNSKENVAELALCVRGHGISADVFNPGFGIPGIWGYQLCSEKENAYRSIYSDCVRAIDFLFSQKEIDSSRIGVAGGSQGGGLTLVTAGLCKNKIAACAYFDPFPCDISDFINIREICQSEIKSYLKYYNNSCDFEQTMQVQELLNTRGFAHWITCPVFFATSLFDDDCPPHVGFSAYNLIKTEKQYKVFPNDSHLGESNYYSYFMAFFKKQFKY